jgi:hypothetical protein
MRRLFQFGALAVVLAGTLSGCVVREERVVARPGPMPCRGGVWIEGHYGPRGHWHQGHWRCPGVIERVEVY